MEISNKETAATPNNRKNIIIKSCILFTDCINEINNTQIGNDEDIHVVMQSNV